MTDATQDRVQKWAARAVCILFGVVIGATLTGWWIVAGIALAFFVVLVTAFGWWRYP